MKLPFSSKSPDWSYSSSGDYSQRTASEENSIRSTMTTSSSVVIAPDVVDKYGYEDATPDIQSRGEEERRPSINEMRRSVVRSRILIETSSPEGIYKDFHKPEVIDRKYDYDGNRVPRRSSMKGTDDYAVHRRTSLGSQRANNVSFVEVIVRGNNVPIQRRRSIDFNANVQVKEVVPMTCIGNTQSSELWLQPEDFEKMKLERKALVEKHKQQKKKRSDLDKWGPPKTPVRTSTPVAIVTPDYPQHGRSGYSDGTSSSTSSASSSSSSSTMEAAPEKDPDDTMRGLEKYWDKSSRMVKNRSWDSVLFEQDEQEYEGVYNDERIAEMYRTTAYPCPQKAIALAQKDHEAVRDYLMSPRTTQLMMMRRLSC